MAKAIKPSRPNNALNVNAMLSERWCKFLLAQPETGMDYQVVAVTLRDGSVIEDVAVIHHSIVAVSAMAVLRFISV